MDPLWIKSSLIGELWRSCHRWQGVETVPLEVGFHEDETWRVASCILGEKQIETATLTLPKTNIAPKNDGFQ